jgi:cytochrome c-type biogenesis protein CcmH
MKPTACLLCLALILVAPIYAEAAAEVSDKQVKDVAKVLACLCGTCPRRPLDECSCGWADKYRARIGNELGDGKTKEVILAGFVDEFGLEVYNTPPAEGFNISAWVMPFFVLGMGLVVVWLVMRSWLQQRAAVVQQAAEPGAEDAYLSRLEDELKEREL